MIFTAARIRFRRVSLLPGSRPLPADPPLSVDALERTRRVDCARYDNCLDHAEGEQWGGWSCAACPVRDRMTQAEHRADLEGLAALLAEIAGPKGIRLRNAYFWESPQIKRRLGVIQ